MSSRIGRGLEGKQKQGVFLEENESELGRENGVGTSWEKKAFNEEAFRGSEEHPQVWILCKSLIHFFLIFIAFHHFALLLEHHFLWIGFC